MGRGRFGSAVENIGDIDLDGLSDVAVSAPYEGMGVVYIYRGSESGLVSHDYQVHDHNYQQMSCSILHTLQYNTQVYHHHYTMITVV